MLRKILKNIPFIIVFGMYILCLIGFLAFFAGLVLLPFYLSFRNLVIELAIGSGTVVFLEITIMAHWPLRKDRPSKGLRK